MSQRNIYQYIKDIEIDVREKPLYNKSMKGN